MKKNNSQTGKNTRGPSKSLAESSTLIGRIVGVEIVGAQAVVKVTFSFQLPPKVLEEELMQSIWYVQSIQTVILPGRCL